MGSLASYACYSGWQTSSEWRSLLLTRLSLKWMALLPCLVLILRSQWEVTSWPTPPPPDSTSARVGVRTGSARYTTHLVCQRARPSSPSELMALGTLKIDNTI